MRKLIQNMALPPGGRIELDQTHEAYLAEPGLNFSSLKAMGSSPLAYQYQKKNPIKATSAMSLGTVAHLAILEPAKFLTSVAVFEGKRRVGKEWEAFKAENERCMIMKPDEYKQVLGMSNAVGCHKVARESLIGGACEVSIFWTDTRTGLECKARLDAVSESYLTDLKTTSDIDPGKFSRLAGSLGYHAQLHWYSRGWFELTGKLPPVRMVVVQSKAPFDVICYEVPGHVLDVGKDSCTEWVDKLVECQKSGIWPGISAEPVEFDIPGWLYPDLESNDEEQPF